LRDDTPRLALATPFRGGTLGDVAAQVLDLARAGLQRRARLDSTGQDESHFLATLHETVELRKTPAERLLERYAGPWGGVVEPIYHELAY